MTGTQRYDAATGGNVASLVLKVATAVLTAAVIGAYVQFLDHGTRLTKLETRYESIAEDITEIKGDVKKLLETR